MLDGAIEIEITQPGRPTGQYIAANNDQLKLKGMYYPEEALPFDLAILPRTLSQRGDYLRVLLFSSASHPPKTLITARPLGGLEGNGTGLIILAVPAVDPISKDLNTIFDLPEQTREDIFEYLELTSKTAEEFQWKDKEEIGNLIKQASIQYRQAEVETRKQSLAAPAWRPADRGGRVIGYTEAEHYTEAEYTFFQLPYHFQHYVKSYLADDERILYALRRQAMRSCRQRSWLGGVKLQEGILILTTQRLLQLVELTPPGDSGVRYGFNAQLGALERLDGVSVEPCGQEAVVLRTRWIAQQNAQTIEWEFPSPARPALDELCSFLQKFINDSASGKALRRTMPSPKPDALPRLTDPAANRPEELDPINERFASLLPDLLKPDEKAYAWALWPAWFDKKGVCQILLVTNQRVQVLSDPIRNKKPTLEVPLFELTILEYVGSILSSHIKLFVTREDGTQELQLSFPYSAEAAFHNCFEAMRRCMAAAPLQPMMD
jgi:inorganic pyrophosphatase